MPDQNPPFEPLTARAAPEALKAMGLALVKLGIKDGDLAMVREGRELQHLAAQKAQHPKL